MLNKRAVSGKKFITNTQVFYPVGVTKCCNDIFIELFKSLHVTATQMIVHHSINFYEIENSFKLMRF